MKREREWTPARINFYSKLKVVFAVVIVVWCAISITVVILDRRQALYDLSYEAFGWVVGLLLVIVPSVILWIIRYLLPDPPKAARKDEPEPEVTPTPPRRV